MSRLDACVARLNVSPARAARVLARDADACERTVAEAKAAWDACPVCQDTTDEHRLAHVCLRRLWFARDYEVLARVGAPVEDAYPCDGFCSGTGRYDGKTYVGTCHRCDGKGYMTSADRKRCWGYDHFYRRISA